MKTKLYEDDDVLTIILRFSSSSVIAAFSNFPAKCERETFDMFSWCRVKTKFSNFSAAVKMGPNKLSLPGDTPEEYNPSCDPCWACRQITVPPHGAHTIASETCTINE